MSVKTIILCQFYKYFYIFFNNYPLKLQFKIYHKKINTFVKVVFGKI